MEDWQLVMALSDVKDDVVNKAEVRGIQVILLRQGDGVFVYEDACPHEGHPLSQGDLEADVLICAKHLWEFEIQTGKHISRIDRPENNLKCFPVRIVGGSVEIDLSGARRPRDASPPTPAPF